MLAQGEFTRFLNSKDKDKASILEKITGVSIYSEIGMAIYKITDSKDKELDKLKARNLEIEIPSEEEIEELKNKKFIYSLSLVLGGIGFISTKFLADPYLLFISFLLIGCAWAAMLALPFTILTNSLSGGHMGTYLGLFNGTICLPQIVAAVLGGLILKAFTPEGGLAPEINMLVLAGVFLVLGALSVFIIKEKKQ